MNKIKNLKTLLTSVAFMVMILFAGFVFSACDFGDSANDEQTSNGEQTVCTITFETDNGSSCDSLSIYKGKSFNQAHLSFPTIQKDGYTFAGWFVDSGKTQEFTLDTKVIQNLTLYAKWVDDNLIYTYNEWYDYYEVKVKNKEDCTSITIPSTYMNSPVKTISNCGFQDCERLTSITIPSSVTRIGQEAFSGCSGLTSITVPSSVTFIGEVAFLGCSRLTNIVVEEGNTVYDSRNNCNAIIETETNSLKVGCKNTIIPNSVKMIGTNAFDSCALTSITIPNGVQSISLKAFYNCQILSSITISSSVVFINDNAFLSCPNLSKVYYTGTESQKTSHMTINTGNNCLTNATWYYFTSNGAAEMAVGNWWYYDTDGITPKEWVVLAP